MEGEKNNGQEEITEKDEQLHEIKHVSGMYEN